MTGTSVRRKTARRPTPQRVPLTAVLRKGRDIVARQIEDETLLVPIRSKVGGKDVIYTLNGMGTMIWRLIDGKRSVSQVRARILKDYAVTPRRLDADLAVFFGDLLEIGALRRHSLHR